MVKECLIVGLAGGSASGKTSFIKSLSEHFSETELAILSQDNYYKPLSKQKKDNNGEINFDLPSAIDFKRLRTDLLSLAKGKSVQIVEYTFNNPAIFPKTINVQSAKIILVEGLFIYSDQGLKKLFHRRLYIHTSPDIAVKRRVQRDIEERGMENEQVLYQWQNHVIPAYEFHLLPHLKDAHFIIDNDIHYREGLEELIREFRKYIDSIG